MGFFHMLRLRAYWDQRIGTPFLDIAIPIETDERLVDIISKEVLSFDRTKTNKDETIRIKATAVPEGDEADGVGRKRGGLDECALSFFFLLHVVLRPVSTLPSLTCNVSHWQGA